ncbi:hypothetical protein [Tellurirhabdus bombi]|uniref:hypothetical protein n=1 Tax=Tellurirhabdus bombi TaxID=2907205 RepID=UPI001F3EC747|nr:hypothetical protein [Tellurirhabdus bombi]
MKTFNENQLGIRELTQQEMIQYQGGSTTDKTSSSSLKGDLTFKLGFDFFANSTLERDRDRDYTIFS